MQCNGNFKQWFNVFLFISEVWQGYESKAYGVSNHNLNLQCKKLSRTRDIPNFPTQGWADTAFYTSNWSETYLLNSGLFQFVFKERWSWTVIYVSLGQGNVFTGVCHSFCPPGGWGRLASQHGSQVTWPMGLHPGECLHFGIIRDTINKRTVRVLLECILVSDCLQYPRLTPVLFCSILGNRDLQRK